MVILRRIERQGDAGIKHGISILGIWWVMKKHKVQDITLGGYTSDAICLLITQMRDSYAWPSRAEDRPFERLFEMGDYLLIPLDTEMKRGYDET